MIWMKALALAVFFAVMPAAAQEAGGFKEGQRFMQRGGDIIKPSQAVRIALQVAPDAKALDVQLRGPLYIVKLKQGNRVIKVRVDAGTGAIR